MSRLLGWLRVHRDLVYARLLRRFIDLGQDDLLQAKGALVTIDQLLEFLCLAFDRHFSRSQEFRVENTTFIIILCCWGGLLVVCPRGMLASVLALKMLQGASQQLLSWIVTKHAVFFGF